MIVETLKMLWMISMVAISVGAVFVSNSPEEEEVKEIEIEIGTGTGTGTAIGNVIETEIAIDMIRKDTVILTPSASIVTDTVTGREIVPRSETEENATIAESLVINLESAPKGK